MAVFQFADEDVRPNGGGRSRALTEEEEAVLAVYRQSLESVTLQGAILHGQPKSVTFESQDDVDDFKKLVAKAAALEGEGYRFREVPQTDGHIKAVFWGVKRAEDPLYVECPECEKVVRVTSKNEISTHGPRSNRCAGSGLPVEVES